MKNLKMAAMLLTVVGGVNWGLVGLLNMNLVTTLLGAGTLTNIVYDLVGLSAVYVAYTTYSKK